MIGDMQEGKEENKMSKEQMILIELEKMLDYGYEKNRNSTDDDMSKYSFIQDNLETASFVISLVENMVNNNDEVEHDTLYNELNEVFNERN